MKRFVIIAAAATAVAGVAAAAPASAAPERTAPGRTAPAVSSIDWSPCPTDVPGGVYLENAECGQLEVPLDHSKPNGRKISIAVSRVKATDRENYQGVLVGNPGGPGGTGLYLSGGLSSWLPDDVAAKYDVIGFDPRGVGISKPAMSCVPDYNDPTRADYVPDNFGDEARWLVRSAKYARACERKYDWLLPHMRTTDAAQDLDAIRRALGQEKISYYGFSYGTYLGATYATMFPKNIKRMVWDGNVDSREVWYGGQLKQNAAFERNIDFWFEWIAKHDSVYHLGTSGAEVEKLYYDVRAKSEKDPIGGRIGPSELDDIVLSAGYNTGYYIPFAQALSAWVNGKDPAQLLSWVSEGGGDNGFAVYLAVQAADAPWPKSWWTWHRDASNQYKNGITFVSWGNTWFNAPIYFWGSKQGPRFPIGDKKGEVPRFLLVQSTLDAATPYPGGPQMRRLFPSATLLAEKGGKTHSNTLNGNPCLDDKVAAYLGDGTLAPRKPGEGPDVSCDALPALNDPDPTSVKTAVAPKGKDVLIGRP